MPDFGADRILPLGGRTDQMPGLLPATWSAPEMLPNATSAAELAPRQTPNLSDQPPGPGPTAWTPWPALTAPSPRSPQAAGNGTGRWSDGAPAMALASEVLRREGHGQPLPLGAQDALHRTLGTSVRDIRVVRSPSVQSALRQVGADALTVGRTVLLPADLDLDTPAGHALAAHELTHAIRHDRPGFVPQVLRQSPRAVGPSEEDVALATEHAAHAEHRERQAAPGRHPGVPAPWEPLPFWSGSDTAVPDGAGGTPGGSRAAPPPSPSFTSAPSGPPPEPRAGPTLPGGVYAAASGRASAQADTAPSAPSPSSGASGQGQPGTALGSREHQAPTVDLDQLARDVYHRLRDRLNEEVHRIRS